MVVTNSSNCKDFSNSINVFINPNPTAGFNNNTVCLGAPTLFTDNSSISSGSISTYNWNFGDGNTSTNQNPNNIYANAGTYNVRLLVTSNNGCIDSIVKPITVYARATVGFNTSDVCFGNPANFSSTSSVAGGSLTIFLWNFGDGNTSATPGTSNIYTAPGTYHVTLTVTTNNGCIDSFSKNVNVFSIPTIVNTTSGPTSFCQGGSVTINATSSNAVSYQWFNNGTLLAGDTNSSYIAKASGNYKVMVTNSNGCIDSSSAVTVTVNPLPITNISTTTSTSFCQGSNVLLKANNGVGFTYQWRRNGSAINGATDSNYMATTSGSYKVVIKNINNCIDSSTAVTVTVYSLPAATVAGIGATTFCENDSVRLKANGGTGLSFQWTKSSSIIPGANDSVYVAKTSGTYKVIVTNSNACKDSSSGIVVVVNPLPASPVITRFGFKLSTTSVAASYQWLRNDSIISGTQNNYDVTINGIYKLRITDANGCSAISNQIVINNVGIQKNTFIQKFSVYPNPAKTELIISGYNLNSNNQYLIINSLGQIILSGELKGNKTEINIESIAVGPYLIKVGDAYRKFVKE